MKAWYEFYMADDTHKEILHQVGAELQEAENQNPIKLHQLGAEIVSPNRIASIIDDGGMDKLPSVEELTKRLDMVEQELREYQERDKGSKDMAEYPKGEE